VSRVSIYKCIDKALSMGIEAGLKDIHHSARDPVITEEAKAWVVSLACTKPKEHGYAAELWTRQSLADHIRRNAVTNGHSSLARAAKATVQRILVAQELRPHKVTYYLEKRDPEFDEKMREVLMVYQEVHLQNEAPDQSAERSIITVSVDEKPGVQAIANTAPDRPPVPGFTPPLRATTSTNGTVRSPFWQPWTCTTAT
jgi:hypothetical protein